MPKPNYISEAEWEKMKENRLKALERAHLHAVLDAEAPLDTNADTAGNREVAEQLAAAIKKVEDDKL